MYEDDDRWNAVLGRDARWDGQFVFAVGSTGIYCRPSCPARRPLRENTRFFETPDAARSAGFRACRRCLPDTQGLTQRMDALVEASCRLLERSDTPLSLSQLAARIGLSPSHLAREFKKRTGMTPKAWAEASRRRKLDALLPLSSRVLDAALEAGYSGTRSLYVHADPLPPASRLRRGAGEQLAYTLAECSLGWLLLGCSEKGICALLLGDAPEDLIAEFNQRFAAAERTRDDRRLQPWLTQVLAGLDEPGRATALPLDLRGTAFQQRVWQALQRIPCGTTCSYGELASQLNTHPRAVARACASNMVGLLVPCHRVVTGSGGEGGYRWGIARKAALLRHEREKS